MTGGPGAPRRSAAAEWVRAVAVLTRVELLRLVRTEEIWRYLLLPALLLLPVLVFGAVLVASARGPDGTVAVPEDLPPELDLVYWLELEDLAVVARADPVAAWERGEVDGAVVTVADGAGIGGARALEAAGKARWIVHVAADTQEVDGALRRAAESAANGVLIDLVVLAGGDPEHDLRVAEIETLDVDTPLPFDPTRGLLAYGIFVFGTAAFFFLSLPVVADRKEGVTEALRALPVPPTAPLWGRLLAQLAVQVVAAVLVAGNVVLLLAPLLSGQFVPLPTWADLPGILAAVVFVDALHVAVGVYAPNAKAANNASGGAVFTVIALLVYGLVGDAPAWVPVAGVLATHAPVDRVVAVVATLAASAAIIGVCGRLLATRVSLVLPGAE